MSIRRRPRGPLPRRHVAALAKGDPQPPPDRCLERSDRGPELLREAGQARRSRVHLLRPLPPPGLAPRRRRAMATTTITAENQNPLSPVERVEPHFYASGLISQGCDVVTVQRALGHASATTTLSTYAHLWPSAEDRTRKAAEA